MNILERIYRVTIDGTETAEKTCTSTSNRSRR